MRKLSILVAMFGIIGFSQAQESIASLEDVMPEDRDLTVLNQEYLTSVQESLSPLDAKFLEGIVSQWDAQSAAQFDGRNELFTTQFNSNKGSVEVSYDNKGTIIKTKEVYRDIAIPIQLKKVIYHRYKDWNIVQSKYYVTYTKDSALKKHFEITIKNGDQKKRIKIKGESL